MGRKHTQQHPPCWPLWFWPLSISSQQTHHLFHSTALGIKGLRNNSDSLVSSEGKKSVFWAYILTAFNPIQCLFQQKHVFFLIDKKNFEILLDSKHLGYRNNLSICIVTFLHGGLLVLSLYVYLWTEGVNSMLEVLSANVKHSLNWCIFFSCTFLFALLAVRKLRYWNRPSWPQSSSVLIKCPVLLLRPLAWDSEVLFLALQLSCCCNFPIWIGDNKALLLCRMLWDLTMKSAI